MSRGVTKGFFIRIEAVPGREAEVADRLRAAVATIEEEPDTIVWLAVRLGPTTFAIVDAFPDEDGRRAHLEAGRTRLTAGAEGLFAEPPTIHPTDVVAAKLPG
jgi:quinol monooxygenase YgiN